MVEPVFNRVASSYRGVVGHKLAKYGLRFDDLQDPLKDEVRERCEGRPRPRQRRDGDREPWRVQATLAAGRGAS